MLAGCPAGGTVLDIFFGSGTTGQVAQALGRHYIGIDIDRRNDALQIDRLRQPSLMLESA
ncbi:Modification methylase DpnIIB [compost metagenome]